MTKKEQIKANKILKEHAAKEVYFYGGKYYLTKDKAPEGSECIKAKVTETKKIKDNG